MRYLRLLIVQIALLVAAAINAQTLDWGFTMGTDFIQKGEDVAVDKEGNVYATGVFTRQTDFDPGADEALLTPTGQVAIFIQKLNKDGELLWVRKLDGSETHSTDRVQISTQGNVYISGVFKGAVDFDPGVGVYSLSTNSASVPFLLKLNSEGEFLWVKMVYNDNYGSTFYYELDPQENVYCGGMFVGTADIDPNEPIQNVSTLGEGFPSAGYIFKLNAAGETVWAHPYLGLESSEVKELAIDTIRNELYVLGYVGSNDIDFDFSENELFLEPTEGSFFVHRMDLDGNFLFAGYTFESYPTIKTLSVDKKGDLIFSGSFRFSMDVDFSEEEHIITSEKFSDAFVLKTGPNLEYIWSITLASQSDNQVNYHKTDKYDNVYLIGTFGGRSDFDPSPTSEFEMQAGGTFNDSFFWKLTSYGDFQWAYRILDAGVQASMVGGEFDDEGTVYAIGELYGRADIDPTENTVFVESQGEESILLFKWNVVCSDFSYSERDVQVCSSYEVPSRDEVYYESGIYSDTIGNLAGCDSIITINLTVGPINRDVTLEEMGAKAEQDHAEYQWLDCNANYAPIDGATEQVFYPVVDGDYAVQIRLSDCVDTSDCAFVEAVGFFEIEGTPVVKVYPNPVEDDRLFLTSFNGKIEQLEVYAISGKRMQVEYLNSDSHTLNLAKLPSGVYTIKLLVGKSWLHRKVIKS